jgi:hypothetical protein
MPYLPLDSTYHTIIQHKRELCFKRTFVALYSGIIRSVYNSKISTIMEFLAQSAPSMHYITKQLLMRFDLGLW